MKCTLRKTFDEPHEVCLAGHFCPELLERLGFQTTTCPRCFGSGVVDVGAQRLAMCGDCATTGAILADTQPDPMEQPIAVSKASLFHQLAVGMQRGLRLEFMMAHLWNNLAMAAQAQGKPKTCQVIDYPRARGKDGLCGRDTFVSKWCHLHGGDGAAIRDLADRLWRTELFDTPDDVIGHIKDVMEGWAREAWDAAPVCDCAERATCPHGPFARVS